MHGLSRRMSFSRRSPFKTHPATVMSVSDGGAGELPGSLGGVRTWASLRSRPRERLGEAPLQGVRFPAIAAGIRQGGAVPRTGSLLTSGPESQHLAGPAGDGAATDVPP